MSQLRSTSFLTKRTSNVDESLGDTHPAAHIQMCSNKPTTNTLKFTANGNDGFNLSDLCLTGVYWTFCETQTHFISSHLVEATLDGSGCLFVRGLFGVTCGARKEAPCWNPEVMANKRKHHRASYDVSTGMPLIPAHPVNMYSVTHQPNEGDNSPV